MPQPKLQILPTRLTLVEPERESFGVPMPRLRVCARRSLSNQEMRAEFRQGGSTGYKLKPVELRREQNIALWKDSREELAGEMRKAKSLTRAMMEFAGWFALGWVVIVGGLLMSGGAR